MKNARKTSAKRKQHRCILYALIRDIPGNAPNMCFMTGLTAKQVWDWVIDEEWLGTGHTKETLVAEGWRAKRVTVLI
jgi:hypothetical protein